MFALLLLPLAFAHEEIELLPQLVETAEDLDLDWASVGRWRYSSVRAWPEGGDRVGLLLTVDPTARLLVQARAVDETGVPGPWMAAEETWRGGDGQRVLVALLGDWSPAAQVRVRGLEGIEALGWAMHLPASEEVGEPAPARPPSVSAGLAAIGVVPRETWGATATTCTQTEDDWYRFAIHHTAGNQTSGGTVQGAVQALQAYAMGTGVYCDIPYQFLVGYDGSLWEGRPLDLYSGATGGGNNDGNIAICFLGCYDSSGCGDEGDEDTLAMIAAARLLAQTLAAQEATVTTPDTLKGHRDWPGNSTACPGDRVYARLDELMSATAHYQGTVVASSFDGGAEVTLGETLSGWVQVRNDGLETWTSNTRLATLPRDQDAPLAASSWIAPTRISAPELDTPPGETATFPLDLYGAELGSTELSLALVEEWVTWFGDQPVGGGPAEGAWLIPVEVRSPEVGGKDTGEGGEGDGGGITEDSGQDAPIGGERPGRPTLMAAPGGCSTGGLPSGGGLGLALLVLLGRRRTGGPTPA